MRLIPALLMAACVLPAADSAGLAVWPVDALVHVFPHAAPDTNRTATQSWLVPRNGHASARCLAEHRQNGILTRLDRWVDIFEQAGIRTIEGRHLLGRASEYQTPLYVSAWVIECDAVVERKLGPTDLRAEASLASFTSALYAHLRERGWTGRYLQQIHDEPHTAQRSHYNRFAKLIRSNLPGIPVLDAVSLDPDIAFFLEVADVSVPVLGSFEQQTPAIRKHVQSGGEAWFYTCIRQVFTGFLHWGGNY